MQCHHNLIEKQELILAWWKRGLSWDSTPQLPRVEGLNSEASCCFFELIAWNFTFEKSNEKLIKWPFSNNFWNQLGVYLQLTGTPFFHRKESYCDVIFPPLNFNSNLTKAIHLIFSPSLISRKTTTSKEKSPLRPGKSK